MLIVHGIYHWMHRRVAFRNDYCLSCAAPRRAVQVRSLDVLHIFWVPLLPLGLWKRWFCMSCGRRPHVLRGTRRTFKWIGVFLLLLFAVVFWLEPVAPDFVPGTWLFRIAAPLGALATVVHLLRTPAGPALASLLEAVHPATDMLCPFCNIPLVASDEWTCPGCHVRRY